MDMDLAKVVQGIYYPDWNIQVQVDDESFFIHKYVVEKFESLKDQIAQVDSGRCNLIQISGDLVDFRNTFWLLYSKSYDPIEHETAILLSALKLATKFSHSELRTFAIEQIERQELPPLIAIPLAQEMNIPHWISKALWQLSSRPNPIEPEEAEALGMELFVLAVAQRESRLGQKATVQTLPTTLPSSRHRSTRLSRNSLVIKVPDTRPIGRPLAQRTLRFALGNEMRARVQPKTVL